MGSKGASGAAPACEGRGYVKGGEVRLAIEWGTVTRRLPASKVKEDGLTHQWVVYVRGVGGASLGRVLKQVDFELDRSFAEPKRTVKEEPFEVEDRAWGEFQAFPVLHLHEWLFATPEKINKKDKQWRPHCVTVLHAPTAIKPVALPGGGGNDPKYIEAKPPASSRLAPVGMKRVDELRFLLADLSPRGKEALLDPAPPRCPLRGSHGLDVERCVTDPECTPQWMTDEAYHVQRLDDIHEGLLAERRKVEAELAVSLWEEAAANQRVWHLQQAQRKDGAKRRKKAK